MWAGIWIDGNLTDVAHYLQAIAEDTRPAAPPPCLTIARNAVTQPVSDIWRAAKPTAAALITARSSGHCEIMAPDCSLRLDTIACRIPGGGSTRLSSAADGYAVCRRCQLTLRCIDSRLARKLGFLVEQDEVAAEVPFYWRETHWVHFDPAGCEALREAEIQQYPARLPGA
jgi:hypothetical protein